METAGYVLIGIVVLFCLVADVIIWIMFIKKKHTSEISDINRSLLHIDYDAAYSDNSDISVHTGKDDDISLDFSDKEGDSEEVKEIKKKNRGYVWSILMTLDEILQSEYHYLSDITTLNELLNSSLNKIAVDCDFKACDLSKCIKTSNDFINSLIKCYEKYNIPMKMDEKTGKLVVDTRSVENGSFNFSALKQLDLSEPFKIIINNFPNTDGVYVHYMGLYMSQNDIESYERLNEEFGKQGRNIPSYCIVYIQRGPRYRMFTNDLFGKFGKLNLKPQQNAIERTESSVNKMIKYTEMKCTAQALSNIVKTLLKRILNDAKNRRNIRYSRFTNYINNKLDALAGISRENITDTNLGDAMEEINTTLLEEIVKILNNKNMKTKDKFRKCVRIVNGDFDNDQFKPFTNEFREILKNVDNFSSSKQSSESQVKISTFDSEDLSDDESSESTSLNVEDDLSNFYASAGERAPMVSTFDIDSIFIRGGIRERPDF